MSNSGPSKATLQAKVAALTIKNEELEVRAKENTDAAVRLNRELCDLKTEKAGHPYRQAEFRVFDSAGKLISHSFTSLGKGDTATFKVDVIGDVLVETDVAVSR